MSALHAALTALTPADVDVKPPHDRMHRRQGFLILRGPVRLTHPIATGRTRRGHRHVVRLMDDRGYRPLPVPPIRGPRRAPGATRPPRRRALRKRRGLAGARAPRHLPFVFQPRILALEARAISLPPDPRGFPPLEGFLPPRDLAAHHLDGVRRFPFTGAAAHAPWYARIAASVQVRPGNQIRFEFALTISSQEGSRVAGSWQGYSDHVRGTVAGYVTADGEIVEEFVDTVTREKPGR